MRTFVDDSGHSWTATTLEEDTPRHHGRWYLVFRPVQGPDLPLPEVRWQNRRTAERTIRTMSEFELRRRLVNALGRVPADLEAVRAAGAEAGRRAEGEQRGAAHA